MELAPGDLDTQRTLSQALIPGSWAERCERGHDGGAGVWNETVGAARGMAVPGMT